MSFSPENVPNTSSRRWTVRLAASMDGEGHPNSEESLDTREWFSQ